jgi:HK97 family phage prohead protease
MARRLITIEEFKAAARKGESLADVELRKEFGGVVKAAKLLGDDEAGEIEVPFVISTASVDRMKDTIALEGWRLENYAKNPVVLWAHNSYSPPSGKAPAGARVEDNALKATAVFASRDLWPFGNMVGRMYLHGYMNAVSVGFQPLKYAWNEERSSWAIDFLEQELLEFSAVPIPANPEALVDAKSKGIDLAPLVEWAEKILDGERGPGLWLPRSVVEAAHKAARGATVVSAPAKAPPPTKSDVMSALLRNLRGR